MTSHKNILYILILYKERKKKTNSSSNTKSNQNIHMPFAPLKIKPWFRCYCYLQNSSEVNDLNPNMY